MQSTILAPDDFMEPHSNLRMLYGTEMNLHHFSLEKMKFYSVAFHFLIMQLNLSLHQYSLYLH